MKTNLKKYILCTLIGLTVSILSAVAFLYKLQGFPQVVTLIFPLSFLFFLSGFLGTYFYFQANEILKKTGEDVPTIFSENKTWITSSLVIWIFALFLGHLFQSILLTNILFWPTLILILIGSYIENKKQKTQNYLLWLNVIVPAFFLSILISLSFFVLDYRPNIDGWAMTILLTGFGMTFGTLLPILVIWQIKKIQKTSYNL